MFLTVVMRYAEERSSIDKKYCRRWEPKLTFTSLIEIFQVPDLIWLMDQHKICNNSERFCLSMSLVAKHRTLTYESKTLKK